MTSTVTMFGIPITREKKSDVMKRIREWLNGKTTRIIATPNPEMLVCSRKHTLLKKALQHSDINIPDGIGVLFASYLLKKPIEQRITGVDMMVSLCCDKESGPIFLLGGEEGIAKQCSIALKSMNPELEIAGWSSVNYADDDGMKRVIDEIRTSNTKTLFVAFGVPKQELWMMKYKAYLPTVRIVMGVGGAFDFLAGKRRRAPQWMRFLGLEWLWRLKEEPTRLSRILKATIVFPALLLWSSLREVDRDR